jgi:hypothetical protein
MASAVNPCSPAVATATGVNGNGFVAGRFQPLNMLLMFLQVAFATFLPGYSNLSLGLVNTLNIIGLLPQRLIILESAIVLGM